MLTTLVNISNIKALGRPERRLLQLRPRHFIDLQLVAAAAATSLDMLLLFGDGTELVGEKFTLVIVGHGVDGGNRQVLVGRADLTLHVQPE